jgi:hypothetical protein
VYFSALLTRPELLVDPYRDLLASSRLALVLSRVASAPDVGDGRTLS